MRSPTTLRRLLASLTALLALAGTARAADLTIVVHGAGPRGAVRAKIFADAASFAARSDGIAAFIAPLAPGSGTVAATFHDLPPGRYAIAAFQDVNGNGQLDTGLFGIPAEPYGLSNGADAFDDAGIRLDGPARSVAITLR